MKCLIAKLLFGLLILTGSQSYAQYSKKQIDSLFDAATQANVIKVDIKMATIVYNASKAINYDKGMVEGLILYTKSSYAAGQYDNAFKYITQAENAAIKINDPILISGIITYKGLCYWRLGFYKEAEQTLKSAIPITKTINNKEDMHRYLAGIYTDLALNYQHMGNIKAKEFWGKKSYAESMQLEKSSKYSWIFVIATSIRGNSFTLRKQYDSAEFYLKKALILADQCTNYQALWVTNSQAGDLYYAKKEFSRSAFYYKKAVNVANQIKYAKGLKDAYAGLAKVYTALNKPTEAAKYFERSNKLGDSLARLDKAAIKTPLNYIVKSKEQQLTANKSRYFRIILLICILFIIAACAVFFYRRRLKKEIKLSKEKMDELLRKMDLDQDKQSPSKIEELKEIVQLAVNNNPAFFAKYNEFDPEFSKKLLNIAPNLVATEMEFCMLLKLNFETKEIARYTKISVRTVEGKKHRIRKKLNIPSNQDINIWMNHI